jgi:glycine/serine hydroxymethyltransferase
MRLVAELIATVLSDPSNADVLASVRARVTALARDFPLYGWKNAK